MFSKQVVTDPICE